MLIYVSTGIGMNYYLKIGDDSLRMINDRDFLFGEVEQDGRLVLSTELASCYGIKPGTRIHFHESPDGLFLHRPAYPAKLYIEPTNQCNLDCRTCIRNIWTEPMGKMSNEVFVRIIKGLSEFSSPMTIVFGGFGEPLFHPEIVRMMAEVKALGKRVEIITNATMLTKDLSRELIRAGLDRLWVSLDGAMPESYADIRLGAALPKVIENIALFRQALYVETHDAVPIIPSKETWTRPFSRGTQLGIVFVAMKRNIADLPEVINIGKRLGADRFMVTNVLPYTRDMIDEALYQRGLRNNDYRYLSLPGMDANETIDALISQTMRNLYGSWSGNNFENKRNRCPFIASRAMSVGWDGNLTPCLPLLHDHTSYRGHLRYEERFSRRWVIGNVIESSLLDLWNMPEYIAFRERVQTFHFSPCIGCGGCNLTLDNEKDCFGNTFPTCGGCLWAQGVVQCP